MMRFSVVVFALVWSNFAVAELKLNPLFADGAVLKRDAAIVVWGTGVPSSEVVVAFHDDKAKAIVNKDGTWRTALKARAASTEPAKLTVTSAGETVVVNDVVVGDVWLCSGQSNMAWALAKCEGGKEAAKAATDSLLRVNLRGGWQP